MGIRYPLLMWEPEKLPKPLSLVTGYPTTMLIDRKGRLRQVLFGPFFFGPELGKFERLLETTLSEKPPKKRPLREGTKERKGRSEKG